MRKRIIAVIAAILALMNTASAIDIHDSFAPDTETVQSGFIDTYGWDKNKMQAHRWTEVVDGETVAFQRLAGYQEKYLRDLITTTKKQLGIAVYSGTGDNMVAVALMELDSSDNAEDPLGSNNCKYNTWFYGRSVRGDAYQWCCVFVMYCAASCGYTGTGSKDDDLLLWTGSCTELYNDTVRKGMISYGYNDTIAGGGSYAPMPGDLMFFKDESGSGYGHIGIVCESADNGWYIVEGNSNNRVQRNYYGSTSTSYRVRQGRIVHIDYPDQESASINESNVWNYLTNNIGFDKALASGMMGYMYAASNMMPGYGATETDNYDESIGLMGWHNERHDIEPRTLMIAAEDDYVMHDGYDYCNFVNYCTKHKISPAALNSQLAYIKYTKNQYRKYAGAPDIAASAAQVARQIYEDYPLPNASKGDCAGKAVRVYGRNVT